MATTTLHLRSETKPLEHRSALTPNVVRKLLKSNFTVNVERSPERIFDDAEFEDAGATLVPEGSWPHVPKDHIIIGLKEVRSRRNLKMHAAYRNFAVGRQGPISRTYYSQLPNPCHLFFNLHWKYSSSDFFGAYQKSLEAWY